MAARIPQPQRETMTDLLSDGHLATVIPRSPCPSSHQQHPSSHSPPRSVMTVRTAEHRAIRQNLPHRALYSWCAFSFAKPVSTFAECARNSRLNSCPCFLEAKLDILLAHHASLEAQVLGQVNSENYVRITRELAELNPLIDAVKAYRAVNKEIADTEALISDPSTEPEMRGMAEAERETLVAQAAIRNRTEARRTHRLCTSPTTCAAWPTSTTTSSWTSSPRPPTS